MSIAATHWALNQNNLSSISKSILFSLAFRANDDLTCFPSVSRIALDTGYTERGVQKGVKELEQLGLIKRLFRKYDQGGNRSNLYRLVGFADNPPPIPPQKTEPLAALGGEYCSPSHPNTVHQGGELCSPINKTLKNIFEKNNNAPAEKPPICEPIVVVTEKMVLPVETVTDIFQPVPDLTVLASMNETDQHVATHELKKVTDTTTQAVILFMLKNAIASGIIEKTPLSYVLGLIKREMNGLLAKDADLAKMKQAHENAKPKPPVPPQKPFNHGEYLSNRNKKLPALAAQFPDSIAQAVKQGYFYFPSDGMFILADFVQAGLVAERE